MARIYGPTEWLGSAWYCLAGCGTKSQWAPTVPIWIKGLSGSMIPMCSLKCQVLFENRVYVEAAARIMKEDDYG